MIKAVYSLPQYQIVLFLILYDDLNPFPFDLCICRGPKGGIMKKQLNNILVIFIPSRAKHLTSTVKTLERLIKLV